MQNGQRGDSECRDRDYQAAAADTGALDQYGENHDPDANDERRDRDAHVAITIFFADRDPLGPYRVTVAARRTLHLRFNDLDDPQPIPRDTDYSTVLESDEAIVVQHTRLDTRQPALALMSTMALPLD